MDLNSKKVGATWEQYEATPEKLRADWTFQIDSAVKGLFPD
jgi:hypothetical protein